MGAFGLAAAPNFVDLPRRMDGVEFCQVALQHPFSTVPPVADDWRLYVVRGDGVELDSPQLATGTGLLKNGTVIGMSGNTPHSFASDAGYGGERSSADWTEMPLGTKTSGNDAVILISRIPRASMPFLSLLGSFIRIDPDEQQDATARIGNLTDWILAETVRNDLMSADIILRLADIISIEISRLGRTQSVIFSERPRDGEYDPRIWRTIAAMSREPQRNWTVNSMAEVAGMSRSAFAVRYHETVGQTPMRSLRRLRMHRAATALASPGAQVIAPLADAMGYGSEAAFNRAFAKEFGYPPKRYGLKSTPRVTYRSKS